MPDTKTANSAQARLKDIKTFFNNGEFFRAYDLAMEALADYPQDVNFAHRAVLSLANAGAIELALQKYRELGLDLIRPPMCAVCLAGLKRITVLPHREARAEICSMKREPSTRMPIIWRPVPIILRPIIRP